MATALLEHVPAGSLFVSEPSPMHFGNETNEKADPAWTNANWLKSRFHFSFAEYSDMRRDRFGVLRVMNDDLVQPHRGFGTHPHRDMEIVTYVVDGELTHQDSIGTQETLGKGAIQFMTAGTGVRHSEHNLGSRPLRFIQIWITPKRHGLKPNYGSYVGPGGALPKGWQHLVSDVDSPATTPVKINQDANFYVMEGSEDQSIDIHAGRQAYLLCVTGAATVEAAPPAGPPQGQALVQHDGLRVHGPCRLGVAPSGTASLLLVEMKAA